MFTLKKTRAAAIAAAASSTLAISALAPAVSRAQPVRSQDGPVVCYYDGQAYLPGDQVITDDGRVLMCQEDGSWAESTILYRATSNSPAPVNSAAARAL